MNDLFQTNGIYFENIKHIQKMSNYYILKPSLSSNKFQLPSWIALRLLTCFVLNTSVYKTKQSKSQLVNQLVDYMFVETLDLTLGYDL